MLPERGVGLYAVYATRDEGALEMREALVEGALDALGAREPAPPAPPPPIALTDYNGWYVLGAHPQRTFEALMGLVAQVHVTAIDGRTLRIKPPAGGAPISASRVGDDLFTTSDGGSIAFKRDGAGHPSGFTLVGSIWDPQGLHRAGLRDAQPLTLAIVAIALACLIARVAIGLVLLVRRRSRPEISAESVVARIGWRASGVLPWILLLVPITAVAGMFISRPPYYELPRGVSLAFGVLTMGAAVGAALPVAAIAAWRRGSWTPARRWFFSIYSASTLALAWTLVHWSLVPAIFP
jgi:hypothetical protein